MNIHKNDQTTYALHNVTAKPMSARVKEDKAVNVGYLVDGMAMGSCLYKSLGFTPSIAIPFNIFFIYLSCEGCTLAIFDAPFPRDVIALLTYLLHGAEPLLKS